MICLLCNNEMILDDVDYNFKGNQDNYWTCEFCNCAALEKIRFNKSISVEFSKGENISE